MSYTADEAFERLLGLRDWFEEMSALDLNEADTRAKVIDKLFVEVLGWSEDRVRRERRTTSGDYLDYHFFSSTNNFIVEAKRSGSYFEMPLATGKARRAGILARSKTLHEALEQVSQYCYSEGVPVGVASNGLQIVVTLTYSAITGYDSILFDGFSGIQRDFIQFYSLLSPLSDAHLAAERFLGARGRIRPEPQATFRMLDTVNLPDDSINRNPIDGPLAPVINHYFSDITASDRLDVLREAYVSTGRQAQYGRQLDALLADRVPQLGNPITQATTSRNRSPELTAGFFDSLSKNHEQQAGNVLLLVGGVGAGKTTFLHRYFSFLIDKSLSSQILPVYIDFTRAGEDNPNLGDFVDREVMAQLEAAGDGKYKLSDWNTLQKIYEEHISRMKTGVLAPFFQSDVLEFQKRVSEELQQLMRDLQSHVKLVVKYLSKAHAITLCVIFDNVDQLSQDFQHKVLKLAFQKAKTWGIIGLLCLREETYWRFRNGPPFDAYHRHVYHISGSPCCQCVGQEARTCKERSWWPVDNIDFPFWGPSWTYLHRPVYGNPR